MKANSMRTPLLKSGAVLLGLALVAYLTISSPEGGVLNSVGQIIIGAFRLVQWTIAMAIALAFSIAFLIGVFLFAVSLVNKETAAAMYQAVKAAVLSACQPILARFGAYRAKDVPAAQPVNPAPAPEESTPAASVPTNESSLKADLQSMLAGEMKKVTDNQQALNEQFATLNSKMQTLEEKSADFAAASQMETIAAEIAASGKILNLVQENMTALEGKLNATTAQLQAITPATMLGDIPARLEKLEQSSEKPGFDPAPLTASIETLHKDVEELKKKGTVSKNTASKTKKKS